MIVPTQRISAGIQRQHLMCERKIWLDVEAKRDNYEDGNHQEREDRHANEAVSVVPNTLAVVRIYWRWHPSRLYSQGVLRGGGKSAAAWGRLQPSFSLSVPTRRS